MPADDVRSDDELVAAVALGDHEAFATLYGRHRDWVFQLAWRLTGDRDLALDVLQDAFAHLYTRFPGFRLSARMTTYLHPVVRHLARDRRRARERERGGGGEPPEPVAPSEPPGEGQRTELAAVLRGLPEAQRDVLLLRFVDDLELAEIAAVLAIPVGTVKSRLHIALVRLREDPRTRAYFAT